MTFSVKSPLAGQSSLLADIRHELTTLDKNVPMVDVKTETQVISQVLFLDRTFAALSSAFGFLALLLACVGLYGTMAYAVARKTNEIGIRMALGAERGAILGMVLRETADDRAGWNCRGSAGRLDRQQLTQDPAVRAYTSRSVEHWTVCCGNFAGNDACGLHSRKKGIESGSDGGIAVRMRVTRAGAA